MMLSVAAACGGADSGAGSTTTPNGGGTKAPACTSLLDRVPTAPARASTVAASSAPAMQVIGGCAVTTRYTGEIAVKGTLAYTSTWGQRSLPGNAFYVWDVSSATPSLVDSVIVTGGVTDIGDIEVSDDGKILVIATEYAPGWLIVYDLSDPKHPREVGRFANTLTAQGVHTAKLGRVNGKLYAFLAIYPSLAPRILTVDLSNPSLPQQVYTQQIGRPWMHDTFFRDGILLLALWFDGVQMWDLGGAGNGLPSVPRIMSRMQTVDPVHNIWWYKDASGSQRYVFAGHEAAGTVGATSAGDITVIDISDLANPREVAFFHVDGAGTHNFSVDEANGILYAAYYNGGVRAIDVRGDLSACTAAQKVVTSGVTRCDLAAMGREIGVGLLDRGKPVYVWGVQYANGNVYASDMLNGIWIMKAVAR